MFAHCSHVHDCWRAFPIGTGSFSYCANFFHFLEWSPDYSLIEKVCAVPWSIWTRNNWLLCIIINQVQKKWLLQGLRFLVYSPGEYCRRGSRKGWGGDIEVLFGLLLHWVGLSVMLMLVSMNRGA